MVGSFMDGIFELLAKLDIFVLYLVNRDLANSLFDHLMPFLSDEVNCAALALPFVVLGFVKKTKGFMTFIFCTIFSLIITDLVAYRLLKPYFERPRPCYQLSDVRSIFERCGSEYGFPSNHAANGMAVLVIAFFVFGRSKVSLALLVAVVMVSYSRIYLGNHYLGDILGGYFTGGVISLLIWKVYQLLIKYAIIRR